MKSLFNKGWLGSADSALQKECRVAVDHFFADSTSRCSGTPALVIIFGGVACGKTTYRRREFATGFVTLDAVEVFLALGYGASENFPPADPTSLNLVGREVARRAVEERRNLVIEMVSNFDDQLQEVLAAASRLGYSTRVVVCDCSPEVAIERNNKRTNVEISSYFAQPLHARWLLELIG